MKYKVQITTNAKNDLKQIFRYISDELLSPDTAIKLYEKFSTTILSLQTMPKRYSLVKLDDLAIKGIRKIVIENYLIFYNINETTKEVFVLRVLYQRRNWTDLL